MLAVSLLGSFRATWCGEPMDLPGRRLVADLWIYLLLHRDLPLPIGRLLGAFWPDVPEQAARANLRRYLHFLGQVLPELPEGQAWYHRDREHLRWNTRAPLTVDLDAFERQLADARERLREGDTAAAITCLEQVAAELGGDLLPDCDASWMSPLRERHRSQLTWCLDTLARLLLRSGRTATSMALGERLLEVDPQRTASRQLHLWLLQATGRTIEAAAEARAVTLDPAADRSPELQALGRAILTGASLDPWHPGAILLPSAQQGEPGKQTVVGSHGRLPVPGDRFIGRVSALLELRELTAIARQVTLVGMGGAGKTRLAIALATTMAAEDGITCLWVDLTAVSDVGTVDREVSTQLGLRAAFGVAARDGIIAHLEAQDSLLIVDNCEQVLEGAADLVTALLARCPRLKVLATSRERLGLPGEAVWPVPAMQSPAEGFEPGGDRITEFDAPALFLARVREQWPDYIPDAGAARAIARICRLVEGIPLAIELAAARITLLDVEDIARRLESDFSLLRRRDREHPDRHQTLDMAINWGYQLLLEDEQLLLARLAVFTGGFTLPAAQAVCSGAAPAGGTALPAAVIEEHVYRLCDKSFMVSLKADSGRRYQMPEMIRQFSLKRLAERAEDAWVSERHVAYQVQVVEEAEPHLRGADAQAWLDRLDEERGNLEAAMVWILDHQAWPWAYRFSAAAGRYWYLRGHVDFEREWLDTVLAQPEPEGPGAIGARARYGAGLLAYAQGDFAAASAAWSASAATWRQLGDRRMVGLMVDNLGRVALSLGDLETARGYLDEAVDIRRSMDDGPALAASLNLLAEIATRQGRYLEGMADYRASLGVLRAAATAERQTDLDNALCGLANVMLLTGDYEPARELLDEALVRSRDAKQLVGQAGASYYMGRLETEIGAFDAAGARYAEALALRRKLGFEAGVAWVLHSMGEMELRRGRYPIAGVYLGRSLATKEKLGDPWNAAFTHVAMAELASLEGDLELARGRLATGLELATQGGNGPLVALARRVEAQILLLAGDPPAAAAALARGLEMVLSFGEQRSIAVCLDLAARVAEALDQPEDALRSLVLAEDLRRRIGAPRTADELARLPRVAARLSEPRSAAEAPAPTDPDAHADTAARAAEYLEVLRSLRESMPD